METSFLYQNKKIFYRTEGKGTPVVLLHGFGEDRHIWDRQIEYLAAHCLLLIPDLPGSGKSEMLGETQKPDTQEYFTMDDYADCIEALLKNEEITGCTMLGHSMGGYITLAFAEKYPGLLTGFGLVHSTAFADSEEKKKIREKGIGAMGEYGAYAFLKNTIPNLFGSAFKKTNPAEINKLVEAAKNFTAASLQQYYRAMMMRPDRTHVLKSNRLPVLFVMGTEDIAAPMEDVLQQTSLPVVSYIQVLEQTGHMGMWEDTATMNRILLEFINRPNHNS